MKNIKINIIIIILFIGAILLLVLNIKNIKISNPPVEIQSKFVFTNSTLNQTVEILEQNASSIKFRLVSENKLKNISSSIDGIAKAGRKDLGLSNDCCDPAGNSFFFDEYVYDSKDCWISFELYKYTNEIENNKMKISEANCKLDTPDTPFKSENVLVKQ